MAQRTFDRSKWIIGCTMAVVALLAIAPAAVAQPAAGIIGTVTDESGAILPGVTVTATSSALQVPSANRPSPMPSGGID